MPPYDPRAFIKLMFLSIGFLLICTYLFANENGDLSGEIYPTNNVKVIEVLEKIEQVEKDGDKVYWNKITEVKPKNTDNQYCFVKVIIKESDNQIMKEEIFGPILPIISYKSKDEAIQTIQKLPTPLAFYVMSNKRSNINYLFNVRYIC